MCGDHLTETKTLFIQAVDDSNQGRRLLNKVFCFLLEVIPTSYRQGGIPSQALFFFSFSFFFLSFLLVLLLFFFFF